MFENSGLFSGLTCNFNMMFTYSFCSFFYWTGETIHKRRYLEKVHFYWTPFHITLNCKHNLKQYCKTRNAAQFLYINIVSVSDKMLVLCCSNNVRTSRNMFGCTQLLTFNSYIWNVYMKIERTVYSYTWERLPKRFFCSETFLFASITT